MPSVLHIFRAIKRRLPMEQLADATLIAGVGLESCAHSRRGGGPRQVLLMDAETLEAMGLAPGLIRENITTLGLNVNGLPLGQQLRLGGARLEVSEVCTPCDLMERIRPGLRKELWKRRGMLCRVLEGGRIRPGDSIDKL